MVVSHLDTDHSGGARTLLQTVPVGELTTSVAADAEVLGAGAVASAREVGKGQGEDETGKRGRAPR